jgi:hypothetical protein
MSQLDNGKGMGASILHFTTVKCSPMLMKKDGDGPRPWKGVPPNVDLVAHRPVAEL